MTRSAYDQAMLDDADRHAEGSHDHRCESCNEPMPCDRVECHYVQWIRCAECIATNDGGD